MELPIVTYRRVEFIETDTGNKVSRNCSITGSQNIILGGKTIIHPGCVIRGDLRRVIGTQSVVVSVGKYSVLGANSIIRPPYKIYKGTFSYYPIKIGDYVHIGENSVIQAATIGNDVWIGKNCIIGRFCIIKECVRIEDNTIVPPNTVVAAFTVLQGNPAKVVDELQPSAQAVYEQRAKEYYARFIPSE